MKFTSKRIFAVVLAAVMAFGALPFVGVRTASAAAFTPVTGWEMMSKLKLGINIGNTLDATEGDWDDHATGLDLETSWGNPKITPDLFNAIAKKGFNFVRLPVTWKQHLDGNYNVDKTCFDRVQQCVDWALDAGLYVILNSHHDSFEPAEGKDLDYEYALKELTAIWKQVAPRFKDYSEKLMFNVMNEPHGANWVDDPTGKLVQSVNKLNAAALKIVRDSGGNNAKRIVMIPSAGANWEMAKYIDFPADDKYVMADIHAYEPWNFALAAENGSEWAVDKFTDDGHISKVFNMLNDELLKKGIPFIIGETAAFDQNNLAERVKWAKTYFATTGKLGIPVAWWSVGQLTDTKNTNSAMALIDRYSYEWYFPEILDVIFSAYNLKVGDDYLYNKPYIFPYELEKPTHDNWTGYMSWTWYMLERRSADRIVVEGDFTDDIVGWGYSFAVQLEKKDCEWQQYDNGDKRITASKNKIAFDLTEFKGNVIVSFAFWSPDGYKMVTRVYLDKDEFGTDYTAAALPAIQSACANNLIPAAYMKDFQKQASAADIAAMVKPLSERVSVKASEIKSGTREEVITQIAQIFNDRADNTKGNGVNYLPAGFKSLKKS
ncbi:hypothetical protein FACS189490_06410 [Clostridia bacterium]|nr:hypothetical protein FACS189490_06410 [Clostridia bacterium]